MKKSLQTFVLAAAALIAGEARAQAQAPAAPEQKFFVNVNVGVQLSDRSISTTDTFPLYDEQAAVAATQPVSGGALFDGGGGYRVWRDLIAGVAVSSYRDTADASIAASIPHPLLFDSPRAVSLTQPGLTRRELSTHIQVGWLFPIIRNVDVAVFVGPSFVRLTQEFVTTVTVAPNTQNATPVVVDQSGRGVGVNLGVDGRYAFTRNVGAGLFLRWVRASVDLDSLPDAKASSVQMGIGGRLRF